MSTRTGQITPEHPEITGTEAGNGGTNAEENYYIILLLQEDFLKTGVNPK